MTDLSDDPLHEDNFCSLALEWGSHFVVICVRLNKM